MQTNNELLLLVLLTIGLWWTLQCKVPVKAAVLMHGQVDVKYPWLHQQSLGCAASYLSFWKMKAQEKAILVVLQ